MYKDNTSAIQKHSAAHVLAMAVSRLYKNTKLGIGPVTKNGFYYDTDVSQVLDSTALKQIELEANKIIQENLVFQQIILPREEAINLLLQRGQIYKAELVNSILDHEISIYKTGDEFLDLCRGPHVQTTKQIGIIKLTKVETSYWNEDITRNKLQRISGIIFDGFSSFEDYNKLQIDLQTKNYLALAVKNNYGFKINEHLIYTEEGSYINERIQKIIETTISNRTHKDLNINPTLSDECEAEELIKHAIFVKNKSYKDFPLRVSTTYTSKSISFIKDTLEFSNQAYNIYTNEQNSSEEIVHLLDGFLKVIKKLDIEVNAEIYTDDFEHIYSKTISNILQRSFIPHTQIITEPDDKIQLLFKFKDKYSKEWFVGYLKIKAFNDKYLKKQIISISSSLFTSELWKILLEKYEGVLPQLFSPYQVVCIPINNNYYAYAQDICQQLKLSGFSVFSDNRSKSLKYKIWSAENKNIPFIVVLGEKESKTNNISARQNHVDSGLLSLDNFTDILKQYFNKEIG